MNLLVWICVALFLLWVVAMFAAFMGGSSGSGGHRSGGNHWLDWLL